MQLRTHISRHVLLVTAVASILLAPKALAGEVYVGPGTSCATIACGLAAANQFNPNSTVTILIAKDNYNEGPLVITRPKTRLIGVGKPKVTPTSPVGFGTGVFEVWASDVHVCGFDIAYSPENDQGGSGFGAQGSPSNPVTDYVFCDNTVEPYYFGAIASVNASGTMLNNEYLGPGAVGAAILGGTVDNPSNVRLIGNHFANAGIASVSVLGAVYDANGPLDLDGVLNVTMKGNLFENSNQGVSIAYRAFSGSVSTYNRIDITLRANTFTGNSYDLTTGSNRCEFALIDGSNPSDCMSDVGSSVEVTLDRNRYPSGTGATAYFGFDLWAIAPSFDHTETIGYVNNTGVTVSDLSGEIGAWDTNASLGVNDSVSIVRK